MPDASPPAAADPSDGDRRPVDPALLDPASADSAPLDPAPADGARAEPAPTRSDVPDEAELQRVAVPATVRRAPRYGAFMVAGALAGMVVGLVVAFATAAGSGLATQDGGVLPFLGGQNGVRWVLALGVGVFGMFVGGALALVADRRSTRRQRAQRP